MLREFKWIAAALILGLWASIPGTASADEGRRHHSKGYSEYSQDHNKHARRSKHDYRQRDSRSHRRQQHYGRGHDRRWYRNNSRYRSGGYRQRNFFSYYGLSLGATYIQPNYVARTLDTANDGQAIVWNDQQAQTQYQVMPTRSYRAGNSRYCREYLSTATVGGQSREVYGQACRNEDGSWEITR
jgi:hypothetical protein